MNNQHPSELIPAFVLDALDPEVAVDVHQHLAGCPLCRAEAAAFLSSLNDLATQPAHIPLPHVKRRLMARIAAGSEQTHATNQFAHAAEQRFGVDTRFLVIGMAVMLALVLIFLLS